MTWRRMRRVWTLATFTSLACTACYGFDSPPEQTPRAERIVRLMNNQLEITSYASLMATAISSDGQRVIVGSRDKFTRIWNANSGHLIAMADGPSIETYGAFNVALFDRGKMFASLNPWMRINNGRTVSWAGSLLRIHDYERGSDRFRFVQSGWLYAASLSKDNRYLTCFDDHYAMSILDTQIDRKIALAPDLRMEPPRPTRKGNGPRLNVEVDVSEDGHRAVLHVQEDDGKERNLDVESRSFLLYDAVRKEARLVPYAELSRRIQPRPSDELGGPRALAISPDGATFAVRYSLKPDSLYFFNFADLAFTGSISIDSPSHIDFFRFHHRPEILGLTTELGEVYVIDWKANRVLKKRDHAGIHKIKSIRFVDESLMIVATDDAKEWLQSPGGGLATSLLLWSIPF